MRKSASFQITDDYRKKAVFWAYKFKYFAYSNPCNEKFSFDPFQEILAVDAIETITTSGNDNFNHLKNEYDANPDWYFGYFGYDLKNQLENLTSNNPSTTDDKDIFFFRPKHILFFDQKNVHINSLETEPDEIHKSILSVEIPDEDLPELEFTPVFNRQKYIEKVKAIINHIIEGDIYELNLCMEFHSLRADFDPYTAYFQLIERSPTPFSAFLKNGENYLLCSSPERFLRKRGNKLISQPIKGTIKRGQTKVLDEQLKSILYNDEKERAENMMIVDLVRNDLARSSALGSVKVEEMFGIYPFRQWYQMISTISSEINSQTHFIDAIKNAFPMGSMTGAPKIKVMELIEKYEESKRGIYSGSFGYITPQKDFDFNVIIRSIIYNRSKRIARFEVGSAITYDAIPEKEYEECLLKAEAIFNIFNSRTNHLKL